MARDVLKEHLLYRDQQHRVNEYRERSPAWLFLGNNIPTSPTMPAPSTATTSPIHRIKPEHPIATNKSPCCFNAKSMFASTKLPLYIPLLRYPYAMMLKSGMKHRISINQGVSPCIAHLATKKYQTRPNFVVIAVRICIHSPKHPQLIVQSVPHP